jgi:Domain of unknown function (DUF6362)
MPDIQWTVMMVEERVVEAADVMKRLPDVCVPGHFNTWPRILSEFSDLVSREPTRGTRVAPSANAISRMEEALEWLKWLEPMDRKIVWLRASGMRWKNVCGIVGLGRAACHEHWLHALCLIALRLSGCRVPRNCSRRRLIAELQAAN